MGRAELAVVPPVPSGPNRQAGIAILTHRGDGLGVNKRLEIRADSTFGFTWTGCLGKYSEADGTIGIDGTRLHLVPDRSDEFVDISLSVLPKEEELEIVRWGARVYLVEPDAMVDFACDVNRGFEPRNVAHGWHCASDGDWKFPLEGEPELPLEWVGCLLDFPVVGAIVETVSDTEGWIDCGGLDGTREGMSLAAWFAPGQVPEETCRPATVIVVRSRAEAFPVQCRWDYDKIAVGEAVTTGSLESLFPDGDGDDEREGEDDPHR